MVAVRRELGAEAMLLLDERADNNQVEVLPGPCTANVRRALRRTPATSIVTAHAVAALVKHLDKRTRSHKSRPNGPQCVWGLKRDIGIKYLLVKKP